jgi:hypothetical protein
MLVWLDSDGAGRVRHHGLVEGRRLFEIIVVLLGLAFLIGFFIWITRVVNGLGMYG